MSSPTANVFGHQAALNPPTSMSSSSYGIVLHAAKIFIIVDAGLDDPVDVLVEATTMQAFEIKVNYEGIKTMLDGDGHPYKTIRLLFTVNNGSVVSARYLYYFKRSGELESLANIKHDAQSSMQMARFILWCEYVRNNLPTAIKDEVKIRKISGKETTVEDNCVICLEEYEEENMIGTLRCKHSYHDKCIKKWLLRKSGIRDCPLCRVPVLYFDFLAASILR